MKNRPIGKHGLFSMNKLIRLILLKRRQKPKTTMDLLLTGQIQFSPTETPDLRPSWRRAGQPCRMRHGGARLHCQARGADLITSWPQCQHPGRFIWKMS
jgi:hypothetical protein